MSGPLVSIVTAAYNARADLQATVQSIAAQSYPHVEHVVIDGGSSDGTPEYLAGLPGTVRWISEPDGGIADAMNKGIALARGDYILVLHAQDTFVGPHSLAEAAEHLRGGHDIVSFDVVVTRGPTRGLYRTGGFGPLSELFATVPHQGAFCRKDLYDRIGGFDPTIRVAMDYEWMLRAKRAGARLKRVARALTVMPATGVSSHRDWPALAARLAENRAIQRRHGRGGLFGLANRCFWLVYPLFKRLRHAQR